MNAHVEKSDSEQPFGWGHEAGISAAGEQQQNRRTEVIDRRTR